MAKTICPTCSHDNLIVMEMRPPTHVAYLNMSEDFFPGEYYSVFISFSDDTLLALCWTCGELWFDTHKTRLCQLEEHPNYHPEHWYGEGYGKIGQWNTNDFYRQWGWDTFDWLRLCRTLDLDRDCCVSEVPDASLPTKNHDEPQFFKRTLQRTGDRPLQITAALIVVVSSQKIDNPRYHLLSLFQTIKGSYYLEIIYCTTADDEVEWRSVLNGGTIHEIIFQIRDFGACNHVHADAWGVGERFQIAVSELLKDFPEVRS
jgi:hypothetical protein